MDPIGTVILALGGDNDDGGDTDGDRAVALVALVLLEEYWDVEPEKTLSFLDSSSEIKSCSIRIKNRCTFRQSNSLNFFQISIIDS